MTRKTPNAVHEANVAGLNKPAKASHPFLKPRPRVDNAPTMDELAARIVALNGQPEAQMALYEAAIAYDDIEANRALDEAILRITKPT